MTWMWAAGAAAVVLLGLVSRMGERSGSTRTSSSNAPPSPERIDELLRAGRKIDAIKAYRTLHGVDLKAAKDAIDSRARELGR
jgi:ribosomal protein L7/L12